MSQKGFVKDVVIVIVGLLVIGGGYFYFSKTPANATANTSQIAEETKDWKTYSESRYGFAFDYPSEYYITEENDRLFIKDSLKRGGLYSVNFIKNPKGLTAMEYFDLVVKKFANEPGSSYGYSPAETKEITINGLHGVSAYYQGGGGNGRSIYLVNGGFIINLDYGVDNIYLDFNGDKKSFDEYIKNGEIILSSIKVIN